jgi:hypothetical protein
MASAAGASTGRSSGLGSALTRVLPAIRSEIIVGANEARVTTGDLLVAALTVGCCAPCALRQAFVQPALWTRCVLAVRHAALRPSLSGEGLRMRPRATDDTHIPTDSERLAL